MKDGLSLQNLLGKMPSLPGMNGRKRIGDRGKARRFTSQTKNSSGGRERVLGCYNVSRKGLSPGSHMVKEERE